MQQTDVLPMKDKFNLIGKTFGLLTVIEFIGRVGGSRNGSWLWRCVCSCGGQIDRTSVELSRYHQHCGCKSREIPMLGRRFGKLQVDHFVGNAPNSRHRLWHCICDCGGETIAEGYNLRSGHTSTCGCSKIETVSFARTKIKPARNTPKAPSIRTPERMAWINMLSRCYKPYANGYANCGGIGIGVCERWRESFDHFLSDVGHRPTPLHRLERMNKSRNFEPGNVEWFAPRSESLDVRLAALDEIRSLPRAERKRVSSRLNEYRRRRADGEHTAADVREILEAQSWRCGYCGISLRKHPYHIDHIIPLARGGSNNRTNIQMLCVQCNLKKGAVDPIDFAQSIGKLI